MGCRTHLLRDLPETRDFFGPHDRIASAITHTVKEEQGGRSIGLTGPWGSGKSTVVQLVCDALEEDPRCHVWVFDAWAHEGDPLRRSFLDRLTASLAEAGWLDDTAHWEERLQTLRGTRSSQSTEMTPIVEKSAILVGLGLLLVPIGASILNHSLRTGLTLNRHGAVRWDGVVGVLLALAPIVLLAAGYGVLWLKWQISRTPDEKRQSLFEFANPLTKASKSSTTAQVTHFETTSLEFDEFLSHLLDRVLAEHPERRLIVVLDNLDRLDSTADARKMWSTLQPFIQSTGSDRSWASQLWYIATYDRSAISRVVAPEGNHATRDPKDEAAGSQAFLDKIIRAEYEVPLPVLSDWRRFLRVKLSEALPDHADEELDAIVDVVATYRPSVQHPPTPRQLVHLVNAIGTFHRRWGHDLPLTHCAAYVLHKRAGLDIDVAPVRDLAHLLGRDLIDSWYAIKYGVPLPKAAQLRLGDDAIAALTAGDIVAYNALLAEAEDLPVVARTLLGQEFETWSSAAPSKLMRCLGVLSSPDLIQQHDSEVASQLAEAANRVDTWDSLDEASDRGLASSELADTTIEHYLASRGEQLSTSMDQGSTPWVSAGVLAEVLGPRGGAFTLRTTTETLAVYASAVCPEHLWAANQPLWRLLAFEGNGEEAIEWWQASSGTSKWLVARLLGPRLGDSAPAFVALLLEELASSNENDAANAAKALVEVARVPAVVPVVKTALESGEALDRLPASVTPEMVARVSHAAVLATEETAVPNWLYKVEDDDFLRESGQLLANEARRQNEVTEIWDFGKHSFPPKQLEAFVATVLPGRRLPLSEVLSRPALLSDNVIQLVRGCYNESEICAELIRQPMQVELLPLVARLDGDDLDIETLNWIGDGFRSWTDRQWEEVISSRRSRSSLISVLGAVMRSGANLELTNSDFVIRHLQQLGPDIDVFAASMIPEARRDLRTEVFRIAVKRRLIRKAYFFERFGQQLAQAAELRSNQSQALERLCAPIAHNKTYTLAGMLWLAETLEGDAAILQAHGKRRLRRFRQGMEHRLSTEDLSAEKRDVLERLVRIAKAAEGGRHS